MNYPSNPGYPSMEEEQAMGGMTPPVSDPYMAAEQAAATDPMGAEMGMTRSAWSTALHEGMAAGKDIRSIMAEFNPGMFGRYNPQAQQPAQTHTMPDGTTMPGASHGGGMGAGMAAPKAAPSVGSFGGGSSMMAPPPPAPAGFPVAPAQGSRPGPFGRLQQRMAPSQPGVPMRDSRDRGRRR